MPWLERDAVDLRVQFVTFALNGAMSITELCDMFEVSRQTGHKWLRRYEEEGVGGLKDRSRAPRRIPHKASEAVVEYVTKTRLRHPTWGARKILDQARKKAPRLKMPSETTVHAVMRRSGLVRKKRRHRANGHPGKPKNVPKAPNELWTTDFKGHFRLRNGPYCYPLTLMDEYSRYLLACQACDSTGYKEVFKIFRSAFREYGLPDAIKSDNG
ncbi:transposase, partial [bacterium AH-315-F18]|nr:transposase [bacterium AH-315-F18]